MDLEQQLFHFLRSYSVTGAPLLLGLSGGADSLALFYALLAWRANGGGPFAAAHLDHGWRVESASEAEQLRQLADEHLVPFHLERATPATKNLEAVGRTARYNFFHRLVEHYGYHALLLAHHADDRAETLLQRIAEGSSLMGLPGLRAVTRQGEMEVWRPLLALSRKEIEAYLVGRPFAPIDDPTNRDSAFQRSRIRHQLLPQLESAIGKGVRSNLCRLGDRIEEWSSYLDRRVAKVEEGWHEGPLGCWIDGAAYPAVDRVEWDHLLRRRLRLLEISLSISEVDQVVALLKEPLERLSIEKGGWEVQVDRGRLFILKRRDWSILSWKFEEGGKGATGWQGLFEGALSLPTPSGEFRLDRPLLHTPFPGRRTLSRWLSLHKVPHFLWERVPALWVKERLVGEFLSGKQPPLSQEDEAQTISIYPNLPL